MNDQRSSLRSDLALVAGVVLATLAVHRHLNQNASPPVESEPLKGPVGISRDFRLTNNPLQVSAAGWKDILVRTCRRANEDRLLATAAGVVFYGLLAIFPAITALVSSYGLFADPSTIAGNLQSLALLLPKDSFAIVQDQIARVLAKGNSSLGAAFVAGLLVAIWSANAGMKAILDALNVAYEEKETRGFFKLNLISQAFTIAGLVAILVMISAVVVVPLVLQRFGLGDRLELIVRMGRWPVMAILLLTALAVLYRYGPSRAAPRGQWLSIGSVVASLLWLGCSSLLSWYLSNFANYTATYGSLGASIGLMMWMWMSASIVLFGAELNSEIEHQEALDFTKSGPKPRGIAASAATPDML